MTWVAVAVGGAAVVGAVASNSAANKQEAAANNSTALQSQIYSDTVNRNAPYVTAGTGAVNQLADLEGTSGNTGAAGYGSLNAPFTAQDYLANQDPGYQFQLQTGENAIQSRDATTGSSIGGAALKDLNNFAQGTAATGYQSAFDRYQTQNNNVYQRLASLAGIGQASANNTAASGNAFGTNAASNSIGAANASAAATVGTANAISGGATNYALLNSLNGGSTTTSTPAANSPSYTTTPTNFDGSLGATG